MREKRARGGAGRHRKGRGDPQRARRDCEHRERPRLIAQSQRRGDAAGWCRARKMRSGMHAETIQRRHAAPLPRCSARRRRSHCRPHPTSPLIHTLSLPLLSRSTTRSRAFSSTPSIEVAATAASSRALRGASPRPAHQPRAAPTLPRAGSSSRACASLPLITRGTVEGRVAALRCAGEAVRRGAR